MQEIVPVSSFAVHTTVLRSSSLSYSEIVLLSIKLSPVVVDEIAFYVASVEVDVVLAVVLLVILS